MLAQHARLAARAGFPADRVLVAEDGDVLVFGPGRRPQGGPRRRGPHAARPRRRLEVDDVVVRDRRHLSADGIVVPVVVLDKQTGRLESPPRS